MRIALAAFIALHGLIHLLGPAKAFGHVAGEVQLGRGWLCALDVDAPSRVVPAAPRMRHSSSRTTSGITGASPPDTARWRGGANVPSVYAFAWLHYAVLSVTRRF